MKKLTDERLSAGIFAFLAVVFWHFRCRTFGPGDSGQHVLAALTWGVSRPPGYPLYNLLGWLWTRLPWSDPTSAVDGLSGIYSAAAAAAFYLVLRRQACGRAAALAATALMAFSPLFWFYAEVAEVRALNDLLAVGAAFLLCRWLDSRRRGDAAAFGGVFGLGVSHHPTFVLLVPAFAFALQPVRRKIKGAQLGAAALAASAGLILPYALLWARLRLGPPPAYDPDQVRTASDVLALFLRHNTGGYFNMFARRHAFFGQFSVSAFLVHAEWMLSGLAGGLGAAGLLAAVGGIAVLLRRGRDRLLFWALWAAVAALVFLVISSQQMPPIDPDYLRAVSLRFYLLPMIGLFALAAFCFDALLPRARPTFGWALVAAAWAAPLAARPLDLRGHDWAKRYGEQILHDSGPRDFVVLAADDAIVSTAYLDLIEGKAGDRVFLLPWLFYYRAYLDGLTLRHPDLKIPRNPDGTASSDLRLWLAANPGRRLCAETVDLGVLRLRFPNAGMRGILAVARDEPQTRAELARAADAFERSPLAALDEGGVCRDTQEVYLVKAVAGVRAAYRSGP